MVKIRLRKWVQVVLVLINMISLVGIMFIDINMLVCLLGMIGYGLSMYLLCEYGSILDAFSE